MAPVPCWHCCHVHTKPCAKLFFNTIEQLRWRLKIGFTGGMVLLSTASIGCRRQDKRATEDLVRPNGPAVPVMKASQFVTRFIVDLRKQLGGAGIAVALRIFSLMNSSKTTIVHVATRPRRDAARTHISATVSKYQAASPTTCAKPT